MPDSEYISFKDMCARFDVTPRTLRYYEYIELLSPHKEGRSRFYGARELARMKLILRGRRFGFSLEDICSIPDDHISPRRSALFMARSVLRELRDGGQPC